MNIRSIILIVTTLISVFITFGFVEPLAQNPDYHDFADQGTFWGIPNTLDSLSIILLPMLAFMEIVAALKRWGVKNLMPLCFNI